MGFLTQEVISLYIKQKFLSILDSIGISESITVSVKQKFISVLDSADASEAITPLIKQKIISVLDSVDVSENIASYIQQKFISVLDSIDASESIIASIKQKFISVYDSADFSEEITPYIKQFYISVLDSAAIIEAITVTLPLIIEASDTLDASENISALVKQLLISVQDDADVQEQINAYLKQLLISVQDDADIQEQVSVLLKQLNISISEQSDITESLTALVKQLKMSVSDSADVAEQIATLVKQRIISVSDSVDFSEHIQNLIKQLLISVMDDLNIGEQTSTLLSQLFISRFESIDFSDTVSVSIPGAGVDIYPSVYDSISMADSPDIAIYFTGDEIKYRVARILRTDSILRSLLSKSADPYGIYFSMPPQKSPPFPLVTFTLSGGYANDAGRDSQMSVIDLRIKAYSMTNCRAIMERIEQLLNHSNYFNQMDTVSVFDVQLSSFGPDDYDVNFNCYTLNHNYKVFAVRKPWLTNFRDRSVTIVSGAASSSPTEIEEKIQTILRADTTLRTLLDKAATPYGVYFTRPPLKSPSLPLVTFKMMGGIASGGWREMQTREIVFQFTAYSKTNADQIISRLQHILNESVSFTGMSSYNVISVSLDSMLPDDFDPEFNAYTKTHRYRIYAAKQPT